VEVPVRSLMLMSMAASGALCLVDWRMKVKRDKSLTMAGPAVSIAKPGSHSRPRLAGK
jgi:hypothetical protein